MLSPLKENRSNSGFTLIELLIVVAIVGTLAAIAIAEYGTIREMVKVMRTKAELRSIDKLIMGHFIDKNSFPNSLGEITSNHKDPWGNDYKFVVFANGGLPKKDRFANVLNTDYDLYSLGRDGLTDITLASPLTKDDIVRAGDGGFVDIGSNF